MAGRTCPVCGDESRYRQLHPQLNRSTGTDRSPFGPAPGESVAGATGETCLARALPAQVLTTDIIQITQSPTLAVMFFGDSHDFRHTIIDRGSHPPDLKPTFSGFSLGKWVGDTLVIDTRGFHDGVWLQAIGRTSTEGLRTIEQFHRRDFGHMRLQFTADDPHTFSEPWKAEIEFVLVPDAKIIDRICTQ